MRIEIFSDVVCPWCYIGKRRLEAALAEFEHSEEVEVVWRSYQLDPTAEKGAGVTTVEALGAKFPGGPDQVRQMLARTQQVAADEGLEFGGSSFHANTVDAHRLLHLALELGGADLQGELKEGPGRIRGAACGEDLVLHLGKDNLAHCLLQARLVAEVAVVDGLGGSGGGRNLLHGGSGTQGMNGTPGCFDQLTATFGPVRLPAQRPAIRRCGGRGIL